MLFFSSRSALSLQMVNSTAAAKGNTLAEYARNVLDVPILRDQLIICKDFYAELVYIYTW
jgi:hypothetical protein